jgi:DNA-binding FrmR family transcriptional regulator
MTRSISATKEHSLTALERSTDYDGARENIVTRLRRIEGQVRGVQAMVERDDYCVDVLTQLSAIMSATRSAGLAVLDSHIGGCVMGTCRHGHQDQQELLDELWTAIERFVKAA